MTKNRLFFSAFNLLPARTRLALAMRLEERLAGTNREFRLGFPFPECEIYAQERIADGVEIIVLGHFHEERRLEFTMGERRGTVYVLPAWRARHPYLRIDPGAEPGLVSS